MFPSESLLSGNVLTPVSQLQMGVFTLSRPRDFISALNRRSSRESSCSSAEGSHTLLHSLTVQSPSQTRQECYNSRNDLQPQSEHQSVPTSAVNSTFREHSESLYRQNGEIYADIEEMLVGAR